MAGFATKSVGSFAINGIGVAHRSAIGGFIAGGIGGAAGGGASGFATGMFMTEDVEQAWEMAKQGALFGGIAGAALGGFRGYKSAKALGNNPWTGIEGKKIPITRSEFGHTFDRHGEESTNFLRNRARGSGEPQGQFLDNQKAAKVISYNLDKLKNGAVNIPLPKGVPA